jgi:hypothetical protein
MEGDQEEVGLGRMGLEVAVVQGQTWEEEREGMLQGEQATLALDSQGQGLGWVEAEVWEAWASKRQI